MKTGLRNRIWKEVRALLPAWIVTMLVMVGGSFLVSRQNLMQIWIVYALGSQLVSAVVFGHEFSDKTIGMLLAQPLSRRRIWWEKMAVLAVALVGLLICLFVVIGGEFRLMRELDPNGSKLAYLLLILPIVIGWCCAPLMTLIMRGTLGGTALSVLIPWIFVLAPWLSNNYSEVTDQWFFDYTLTSQSTFALICTILGYLTFRRLEDKGSVSADLAAVSLGAFTDRFASGSGPVPSLIKKELRLQQPVFLLAGVVAIFWLVLAALKWARPMLPVEYVSIPAAILVVAIPALAGIITVAEERHLGLHDWHLTLPQSPRRQWWIKICVGYVVNFVFGIGLSMVLVGIIQSVFNTTIAGKTDSIVWLILNLWIYSASAYSSSFSSNSLRALLGLGIVACIMATVWFLPSLLPLDIRQPNLYAGAFFLVSNLGFFWILGLHNFRRTLSPLSSLLRQTVWIGLTLLVLLRILIDI